MLKRGLVKSAEIRKFFRRIEPGLFRYPAIDPVAFAARVEEILGQSGA